MSGRWVIALGAVVILGIAAVATVMILNQNRTAQATAQQYFDALAAGDASTANSLSRGWAHDDRIVSLLTDQALGAAVERISDVSVMSDDSAGSTEGDVLVSYTLAGARHTVPLALNRGESDWLFLRTWELNPPYSQTGWLGYSASQKVTLEGLTVETDGVRDARVTLFPGVYQLVVAEPTYFELGSDELVINEVDDFPSMELTPTTAFVAEVQDRVNGFVDDCVDRSLGNSGADGCSLLTFTREGTQVDGTWEVLRYPEVELIQFGEATHFTAPGGRAQFRPRDGGEPIEMERDVEYSGWAEIIDGEVHVPPPAR